MRKATKLPESRTCKESEAKLIPKKTTPNKTGWTTSKTVAKLEKTSRARETRSRASKMLSLKNSIKWVLAPNIWSN